MVDKILKYFASCFPIPNNASVIVAVDVESDDYVISILNESLLSLGCEVEILHCGGVAEPYCSIKPELFDKISKFSYLIDVTSSGFYQTAVSAKYVDVGGSILVMYGMKKKGFIEMFYETDIDEILRKGAELQKKFIGKKNVLIKSISGTEIIVPIKKVSLVMKDVLRYWKSKGKQVTLFGNIPIPVNFERMNGIIAVNDFVWPPHDLGLIKESIILSIKNGFIVDVQTKGDSLKLIKWFDQFSDPNVKKLVHVVFGFIPSVKLSNVLVSNERMIGALTFGFGDPWNGCQTHTDMVVCDAEVFVDGEKLVV